MAERFNNAQELVFDNGHAAHVSFHNETATRKRGGSVLLLAFALMLTGLALPLALLTVEHGPQGVEIPVYLEIDVSGEPLRGVAAGQKGS